MSDPDQILVYTPQYAGKEYCLEEWQSSIEALTYQPRSQLVIDNTTTAVAPGFEYLQTLQARGINAIHIEPWTDKPMEFTMHRCWELCLEEAKRQGALFVFSVEADNILAPEALTVMHAMARYGNCHLVTHDYPLHQSACEASGMRGDEAVYREFGCMLLSTQLLERALEHYDEYRSTALAVFGVNTRFRGGQVILTRRFSCEHRDGYAYEFPQFAEPEADTPLISPVPYMPEDFGSKLPPSLEFLAKEKA